MLFDLGGVLVRLGGLKAVQDLAGMKSEGEVWSRWLGCPWVRRFDRGLCSADEFAAGMVQEWGLSVSPATFLDNFRLIPDALYEGAADLVATVRRHTHVGCLSNSNILHWGFMAAKWDLENMFDATFLSHEIGRIKPDREIFEYVVGSLATPAARIVFLDDNEVNVDGARAVGLTALRVRGSDEARLALVQLGVLAPQN